MHDASITLAHTIDHLYLVFAPYQLHQRIEGCPCCVGNADQQRIRAKPLRVLDVADLEQFAFQTMTTWGNADDFRHFLPRLLELQSQSPIELIDVEILFGKLTYAQWQSWPQDEQCAISNYFSALWHHILHTSEPTPYTSTDDYLCGFAQAVDNLQPYLSMWIRTPSRQALVHLQAYIVQNWDALLQQRLSNAFWKHRPQQMLQVVDWLCETNTRTQLETYFFINQDSTDSDALAAVIDTLYQLQNILYSISKSTRTSPAG